MGERRARALLHNDRLEVAEERVLARGADALVGQDTRDQHGLRIEAAQDELEVGLEEGRETALGDEPVLGTWLELGEDLVAPRADAQATVAEDRTELHERAAVLEPVRAVPGPDDRHAAPTALGHEFLDRFDDAAHVRDVDVALPVPPVRVQEVVLEIDVDEDGASRLERPGSRLEWIPKVRHWERLTPLGAAVKRVARFLPRPDRP